MKIFLILLLNLSALFGSAQNENALQGKWEHPELPKDKAAAGGLEKVMVAPDFALQFSNTHRMSITEIGREKLGDWELLKDGKLLLISMDDGNILEMPVIGISEQELAITYRNKPVIMKRTDSKNPELQEAVKMATVMARKGQLSGEWRLDTKASAAPMEVCFTFSEDGIVLIDYGKKTEKNTWEFSQNNSGLKMRSKKGTVFLNILKINNNELWLQKGNSNNILKMSKP